MDESRRSLKRNNSGCTSGKSHDEFDGFCNGSFFLAIRGKYAAMICSRYDAVVADRDVRMNESVASHGGKISRPEYVTRAGQSVS